MCCDVSAYFIITNIFNIFSALSSISRDNRLEVLKELKSNRELEKAARNCQLNIDLDQAKADWLKTLGPQHKKQIADHYDIFNHLYGEGYFIPYLNLDILYDIKDDRYLPVYFGNVIKPVEALDRPIVSYEADNNSLWTLALTNLDGHLTESNKEYVHWFIANIPGNAVEKGDIVAEYLRPFPVRGTGFHRYAFVLYKQTQKVEYDLPKSKYSLL